MSATTPTGTDATGGSPAVARRAIDFGYRCAQFRTAACSGRVQMRVLTVSLVLFALALIVAIAAIRFGDYPLSFAQVVEALQGHGKKFHNKIVLEWRLPIAVSAVVFGALLGLGGAIFQSLTRNPLGSPDVIGFDSGSYTGVVVAMLVFGVRDYWSIAGASIVGGLITAFVVYLLAWRGGVQGFRLIIVGIGVTAMLGSLNVYLITRAELQDAMTVGFWSAGSISKVTWASMAPALIISVFIAGGAAVLSGSLKRLELGDDAAVTLGTRPGPVRLGLIVVGVATTALVTAAAGPIGFIALVAPQVARRLTHSSGVSLLSASAMGAALLTSAHLLSLLIAQWYRPIPVGLITVCLGGSYLIWLLVNEARRQYGAPK